MPPAPNTPNQVLDHFRRFLLEPRGSKNKVLSSVTIKNYISDLNRFLSWLSTQPDFVPQNSLLQQITSTKINRYLQHLQSNSPRSTLNRHTASLRYFSTFLRLKYQIELPPIDSTPTPPSSSTSTSIPNLLSQFKKYLEEQKKSHSTIKNYLSDLNHFFIWVANHLPQNQTSLPNIITLTNLEAYQNYLKLTQTSSSVIKRRTSSLKTFARFATTTQLLSHNPLSSPPHIKKIAPLAWFKLSSKTPPQISTALPPRDITTQPTKSPKRLPVTQIAIIIGLLLLIIGIGTSFYTLNQDLRSKADISPHTNINNLTNITSPDNTIIDTQTLQGYIATSPATINTVPLINNDGDLIIAANSPTIESTSGTFGLKGEAITIFTAPTSDGDITLSPDGTGQLLAIGSTTTDDFLRITNANLTSGALISGYIGNNTATGNLLTLSSGSSETDRFTVDAGGQTTINAQGKGDAALTVNNLDSSNIFAASTSGVNKFIITNTGRVGVGTTLPSSTFEVSGTFTSSGGVIDLNDSSSYNATNINTGTSTGTVSLGGGSGSVVVNSDTWDISATGVASGLTGITSSGTITLSGLTASRAVFTDASKNLVSTGASADLLASLSDETGTGVAVFNASPTFTTNITVPLVIGGTDTTSDLSFKTTSGVGTTGADMHFLVGNDGGTEAMTILNSGYVGIGTTSPVSLLDIGGGVYSSIDGTNDVGIADDLEVLGTIYGNVSGTITPNFTEGSVVFTNSSGNLAEDNANFFWNDTSNRLGLGTTSPTSLLHVDGAVTGKALAIFNETGDQNILTASASGTTVANLDRNGNLEIEGTISDLSDGTLVVDDSLSISGTTLSLTNVGGIAITPSSALTVGSTGQNLTLQGAVTALTSTGVGNDITLTSIDDLVFNDAQLSSSINLTDTDAVFSSGDTAIVDAINTAYSAAVGGVGSVWTLDSGKVYPTVISNNVGIGTITTADIISRLFVTGNSTLTGKAVAIFDQTESEDILTASASGTTRLTLNNSGDLTISGDLTASDMILTGGDIYPSADSTTAIQINKADGTTNVLNVDTTNARVGIGTTAPSQKLDVLGIGRFYTENVAGINEVLRLEDKANYLVDRGVKQTFYVANGTSSSRLGAEIGAANENTDDSYLFFSTESNGSVGERVRIDSTGNVGIGTTSPGVKLEVYKATGSRIRIDADANGTPGLELTEAQGRKWLIYNNSSDYLYFNDTTGTRMVIEQTTGNVGIGTTSPTSLLHVDGAVTGKALAIFNETGDQNILTASASGTTVANLDRNGNLEIEGSISDITDTVLTINDDLKVGGDDIQDSGGNVIFSFDGAGNIDSLATIATTITQSGANQVTFTGNVDATNGLDVTVADLTVGGSYSWTTTGVITAATNETINGIDISAGIVSDVVSLTLVTAGNTWDSSGNLTTSGNLDVNGSTSDIAGTLNLSGGTLTSTDDLTINPTGGQVLLSDTDTLIIGGHVGNVAYNVIANSGEAPDEGAIAADNDLYIGGDLEVDGTIYGTVVGSVAWDDLTAPDANLSLSMAEYTTGFTWNTAATATAFDGLTLAITNDAATDANTQRLLVLANNDDAGATGTTERLLVLDNKDANEAVTTALEILASSTGTITTAIDVSDAEIVTALSVGANKILGTTGDIDYTNFDMVGSTGNITTGGDIAVNGGDITSTGTLTLNATSTVIIPDADTFQTNDITNAGTITIESGGTVQLGTDDDFLPQLGAGDADIGASGTRWDTIYGVAGNFSGTVTANDFSCTDCLDFTEFANNMTLDEATDIALGALTLSTSGTGALDFNSTGQVSFAGNVDAENGLDVTTADLTVGGANFSVAPGTGNITTAGDMAINGGNITSTVDLDINASGGDLTIPTRTTIGSSTAGVGKLTITGAVTGKALAIFNETGDQNILTASASGTTVANLTRTGDLELLGQGDLKLYDTDSSHYSGFQAADTTTTSVVYKLPQADGSASQVLSTNSTGDLSWIDISGGAGSLWTDGGTYLYPTSGEVLGNSGSAGANKIAGIYLADSSPLYFGTDNDVNYSFSGTTLAVTTGTNDINFDANTLFIDGSADRVGIGVTNPSVELEISGHLKADTFITDETTNHTVFIGDDAGGSGTYGTFVGEHAGQGSTGDYSNAFGYAALMNNTGTHSNAFGGYALQTNKGANSNALGYGTLTFNIGTNSNAVGNYALYYNTGDYSNALGYSALRFNDGANNTALGYNAFNTWTDDAGSAEIVDVVLFASNQLTITGHGLGANDTYLNLVATTTGALPTGLAATAQQWKIVDANTIQCMTDTFSDVGTGTHTVTPKVVYSNSTALGYNAEPDASNQVMLGDASVTQIKTTGSLYSSGAGDNYFAGNVGIAETSPISQLSIGAGSDTAVTDGTTDVSTFGLNLSISDAADYAAGIYNSSIDGDGLLIQAGDASDDYALRVEDYDSANNLFVVRGDGNVGIGTASPYEKLDIRTGSEAFMIGTTDYDNSTTGSRIFLGLGSTTGDTFGQIQVQDLGGTSNNDLILQRYGGNVGIGTTEPDQLLDLYGTSGLPATSGTSQNGLLRFQHSTDNGVLDIGVGAGGKTWLQSTNRTDLSTEYSLLLNPNGGNVGIGTTSPLGTLEVSNNAGGVFYLTDADGDANKKSFRLVSDVGSFSIQTRLDDGSNPGASGNIWQAVKDASGDIDYQAFYTGSDVEERVRIDTNGNVGIGTISPTSLLHVDGAVTGKALAIFNETGDQDIFTASASGTPKFVIDHDGKVGIGTTSPGTKLEVAGNVTVADNNPYLALREDDGTTDNKNWLWIANAEELTLRAYDDALSGNSRVFEINRTGTTIDTITMPNGDVGIGTTSPIGKLHIEGFSGTRTINGGNTLNKIARFDEGTDFLEILGGSNELMLMGGDGESLLFGARSSGTSYEYMRIANNGNVGIGTTGPDGRLDVDSATSGELRFRVGTQSTSADTYGLGTYGNTRRMFLTSEQGALRQAMAFSDASSTSDTIFGVSWSSDTGSTWNPALIVKQGGNVGIGTTSPTSLLHLSGAVTGKALAIFDETGDQDIFTASASGTPKFVIDHDGKIGIGNTAPSYTLDVTGDLRVTDTGNPGITIGNGSTGFLKIGSSTIFDNNETKLSFDPDNDGTAEIVFTNDGDVGIGTTDPSTILDIVGGSGIRYVGVRNSYSNYASGGAAEWIKLGTFVQSSGGGQTLVLHYEGGVGYNALLSQMSSAKISFRRSWDGSCTAQCLSGYYYNNGQATPILEVKSVQIGGDNSLTHDIYAKLSTYSGQGFWEATMGPGSSFTWSLTSSSDPGTSASILSVSFSYSVANSFINVISDGSVGIGTTSPGYNLEIESTTDAAIFLEADTANGVEDNNAFIKFSQDGASVQTILGTLGNAGYDPENVAYTGTLANATLLGTTTATHLQLGTNDNVRMTIESGGNVGIGTTDPAYKLDVLGNARIRQTAADTTATLYLEGTGNTNASYIKLKDTDTSIDWRLENRSNSSNGFWIENHDGTNWTQPFKIEDSTPTNTLYVDNAGNVGIGKANPSYTLEINDTSTALVNIHSTGSGGTSQIELGMGGTGNRYAYIDFVGDATYTDYGLRIIRSNDGANSNSQIVHRGTGYLQLQTSDSGSDILLIPNDKVGIGNYSPARKLDVVTQISGYPLRLSNDVTDSTEHWEVGPADSDNFAVFNESSVGVYLAHGNDAWSANSDERLKTNIQTITPENGLEALLKLDPISFNWKDINANQKNYTGFIAQEVQQILPNLVTVGETTTITLPDGSSQTITDPLGLNYTGFIPYIIKGIQEQQTQIQSLTSNLQNADITLTADQLNTFDITQTQDLQDQDRYQIIDITDQVIESISVFSSSLIANLKTGSIVAQEIVTESLTIEDLSLSDYIAQVVSDLLPQTPLISPLAEFDSLQTNLISPLASSNLTIDLTSTSSASPTGTLLVKGNASISGTLHADNIEGDTITQITQDIDLLSDNYATASGILADIQARYSSYDSLVNPQETSDPLDTSSLDTSNATVSGDIVLETDGSLILNNLLVENTLITSSLSSNLDDTLYIQPLANAPLDLLAGLMTLSPDGKVTVNGDLWITGSIMAQNLETLRSTIYNLTSQNATIAGQLTLGQPTTSSSGFGQLLAVFNEQGQQVASIDASGSAQFNSLSTQNLIIAAASTSSSGDIDTSSSSNATAGTAILPAGETQIVISNTHITPDTLVYLTPLSDTNNQVLYVLSKTDTEFTVATNQPITTDIEFNYWLIQTLSLNGNTN